MFGIKKQFKKLTRRYLTIDLARNNVVYLAGSARSGTTWLQELINFRKNYRLLFEPFHPEMVPLAAHVTRRRYLRPSNRDPHFVHPIEQIMEGRIYSQWTDRYNEPGVYFRRLIKAIRTNLMLGWLRQWYPNLPIILTLRHPIPVVLSQLKFEGWKEPLESYFQNPELVADFLEPFEGILAECRDRFDRKLVLWCIQNYVPFKQLKANEVHLVFYEDLLVDPEGETRRLFNYLGQPFSTDVLQQMKRPSRLARNHSAVITGEDPLRAWLKQVLPEQVERALHWLSVFGLDAIYDANPVPNSKAALEMLQANQGIGDQTVNSTSPASRKPSSPETTEGLTSRQPPIEGLLGTGSSVES